MRNPVDARRWADDCRDEITRQYAQARADLFGDDTPPELVTDLDTPPTGQAPVTSEFRTDDGSVYRRVHPDELGSP